MPPLPLSFWAQAAGAGLQGVLGIGQLIGGALMNPERPTYQIPDEIKNMLALRQMNLGGRMAGATQAQANIMQSQANTVGAYQGTLRNPNAILAGVSAAQGQTNRAFGNLGAMEAQDYQRRLAGLEGAQRSMAQYRDKAFEINEMQPYIDEARTKAALIGAGLRNISGGAAGVAGAVGENEYMNMVRQMYGLDGNTQVNTPVTSSPLIPTSSPQPVQSMNQPMLPNVNFFGQQEQQQGLGMSTLLSSAAFNEWVRQTTGKNSTEYTPMQLAFLRQQYRG